MSEGPRTNTRRVLVVEDDQNTQELYKDAFGEMDFEVSVLFGADGAFLEKVTDFNPDIIAMDIMIGKAGVSDTRDGLQALELLKQDPRTEQVPVVMLSNFVEEGKVQKALSLGARDYIVASGNSPSAIARQFLILLSDPDNYEPMHPAFRTA